MSDQRIVIRASDCRVYLASPVDYEQCVAWVETDPCDMLFIVSDEKLDGNCMIEFANSDIKPERWKMPVEDLLLLLAQAKHRLRLSDDAGSEQTGPQ
jgi:hypothetical protein